MTSPGLATSSACWMVRKGAAAVPGLPSAPEGATKRVGAGQAGPEPASAPERSPALVSDEVTERSKTAFSTAASAEGRNPPSEQPERRSRRIEPPERVTSWCH